VIYIYLDNLGKRIGHWRRGGRPQEGAAITG
jgi:hypothetical protein